MDITKLKEEKAINVGIQTLVAFMSKEFPIDGGNCFSVHTESGKGYQILNFGCENLEEAIRRGVTWPITILVLQESNKETHARGCAVIHDPRIPNDWYWKEFCESCAPRNLLSSSQRLRLDRELKAGIRTERETDIGTIVSYDHDKRPELLDPDKEKPKKDSGIMFIPNYPVQVKALRALLNKSLAYIGHEFNCGIHGGRGHYTGDCDCRFREVKKEVEETLKEANYYGTD